MNTALLTIDDIPSRNTPAIVDYLNAKGIKAILFATGTHLEKYWEEACYAVRHGMIVGNHSYSHPGFSKLPLEECVTQIERCEVLLDQLYRECSTERTHRPFRFPYGDKGGDNKAALQEYLRNHGFNKVDDTAIPYPWWKDNAMDTDIDTFWTFDFEEYRLQFDSGFTKDHIWAKINDPAPKQGAALFGENNRHIILLHAHDETEEVFSEYYKRFIDHLLAHGLTFDEPRFL